MATATRRATSLRPGQFKHLLRVASVTGRMPERDVMLLWVTIHTTGVRVTELALLEVADVLYPSGAVRPEVYRACDASTDDQPALPASRYRLAAAILAGEHWRRGCLPRPATWTLYRRFLATNASTTASRI